ncbi:hypothetical protein NADFUDRAFT_81275 [Nadsonia fulvescens var. elongata DSM 6958]|uniref:J domain-containing protein n=1 Tax=Nadsonia fulvescens var. elongata DSM 6958 TaxID=857566 RepID=A0A1E3PSL9_9ASCO|nr:hypothetical protein NADFUDRAFT_81275 [Nadsonia fulvescens var. elongata DSM 6958]
MVNSQLIYISWFFLPTVATKAILFTYYKVTIAVDDPVPQPGSAQYVKDYRRVLIIVLTMMSIFQIVESFWNVLYSPSSELSYNQSWYSLLGVKSDVDGKTLKKVYRKLSVQYHPDKITLGQDTAAAERRWIEISEVSRFLTDPVLKFGYDKFGPQIKSWLGNDNNAVKFGTPGEILMFGMRKTMNSYYILSLVGMLITWGLGIAQGGKYFRWLIFASQALLEYYLLIRASPVAFFSRWNIQTYQVIQILRNISLALFISLSQLSPLLLQLLGTSEQEQAQLRQKEVNIDELLQLTNIIQAEIRFSNKQELEPFANGQDLERLIQVAEQDRVQAKLIHDPEIRLAIGEFQDASAVAVHTTSTTTANPGQYASTDMLAKDPPLAKSTGIKKNAIKNTRRNADNSHVKKL